MMIIDCRWIQSLGRLVGRIMRLVAPKSAYTVEAKVNRYLFDCLDKCFGTRVPSVYVQFCEDRLEVDTLRAALASLPPEAWSKKIVDGCIVQRFINEAGNNPVLLETVQRSVAAMQDAEFLSSGAQVISFRVYENLPLQDESLVDRSEIFNDYWHFDNYPLSMKKIFVYLSDVDDDCGPLAISEAISFSAYHEIAGNRGEKNQALDNRDSFRDSTFKFCGKRGTCFGIATPHVLHRATIPRKHPRLVLQITLMETNLLLPERKIAYEKFLNASDSKVWI